MQHDASSTREQLLIRYFRNVRLWLNIFIFHQLYITEMFSCSGLHNKKMYEMMLNGRLCIMMTHEMFLMKIHENKMQNYRQRNCNYLNNDLCYQYALYCSLQSLHLQPSVYTKAVNVYVLTIFEN